MSCSFLLYCKSLIKTSAAASQKSELCQFFLQQMLLQQVSLNGPNSVIMSFAAINLFKQAYVMKTQKTAPRRKTPLLSYL